MSNDQTPIENYGYFEVTEEEPAAEDDSASPSAEDVANAEHQVELAEMANREAIDWAMMVHRTDPQDELGTIAALVTYATKQDPDRIAIMWAAAIFQLSDREVHSNG